MSTLTAAAPLLSLVYVSSATRLFSKDQVLKILTDSRANNARLGITGMLLYKDGNFMQALEGPEESVRSLVAKIRQDPRHGGYLELFAKQSDGRYFPEWSMGFQNLEKLTGEDVPGFSPYLGSSLLDQEFLSSPGKAHRLLRTFKNSMR